MSEPYKPNFRLNYINTCVSDHLQDSHNRDGQILLSCSLYNQTPEQAAKDLLCDLSSMTADFDVPEFEDSEILPVLYAACTGIDYRPFDPKGNRCKEGDLLFDTAIEECESQAWFYLEWSEPIQLSYTYDIVTPESAAIGDTVANGWCDLTGEDTYPISDEAFRTLADRIGYQKALDAMRPNPDLYWNASEAIKDIEDLGHLTLSTPGDHENSWLSQAEPETDEYGSMRRISVHIDGDPAMKAEILKYFDRH